MKLDIVVLAAGKGTRMKSNRPKVLHDIGGLPMVQRIINTVSEIDGANIHLVVGHGGDQVRAATTGQKLTYAEQTEQLGTGHAVREALSGISNTDAVLVLMGDAPLITKQSCEQLLGGLHDAAVALLSVHAPDPTGYGRIIRETDGRCVAITEHKDASEIEREITEINTGVIAIRGDVVHQYIGEIGNDNVTGEYYLTDIVEIANLHGERVEAVLCDSPDEVSGINSRLQQAMCERMFQEQQAIRLLDQGVHLVDPGRLDVRGDLSCDNDVSIDINCIFIGNVSLGEGVVVGAHSILQNCTVAAGTEIKPFSHIDGAKIAESCTIGPFARIRPGTRLAANAKIGNFVETKNAQIGNGSKVSHLSYIGDATIGTEVNIGAGTITCNYDGVNKHQTIIGDRAFIGSGTQLVAPVTVGDDATIGAGTTLRKDASAKQLTLTAVKQRSIDWARPAKINK
jgi:bifunctional UDP-N-acetylglucosamine pyrophosphorylase/glucosamine-1-phosphate N-acetyltransferase